MLGFLAYNPVDALGAIELPRGEFLLVFNSLGVYVDLQVQIILIYLSIFNLCIYTIHISIYSALFLLSIHTHINLSIKSIIEHIVYLYYTFIVSINSLFSLYFLIYLLTDQPVHP